MGDNIFEQYNKEVKTGSIHELGKTEVPFKDFYKAIQNYIDCEGLDLSLCAQGGAVWTEQQQILFVEDIIKGTKDGRDIYLLKPTQGKGDRFTCADGWQRINALRKFFNNEIKVLGHYYNELEDGGIELAGVMIIHIMEVAE